MPISLPDKMKPANGSKFPLMDAEDIELADGKRLSELLTMEPVSELPEDAKDHPKTVYLVIDEDSGESEHE